MSNAHNATRMLSCPRCRYDVSRLPARHRCPECGFEYDESMFVLEGWQVPDLRTSAPKILGLLALALIGVRIFFRWHAVLLLWAFLGVAAVFVVLHFYVQWRYRGESRALVRYLITADGVARVGKRTGRIYLWRNYSHLIVMPDGRGNFRLHLYPSWWRVIGPPMVNACIEGLYSDAEEIRLTIEHRISHAKRRVMQDKDPEAFFPE